MQVSEISYEPVRDIFEAMKSEKIDGIPLSDVIGGGDPETVASEVLSVLAKYVHLKSQHTVLDVGCGCGRIAAALTQYLENTSCYVGVDILPALVEFGRKFLSSQYPHFKFLLLDQGNFTYDWWRLKGSSVDIAKLSQAMPERSVDLAISVSLFTHLDYSPALDTLVTIGRMLKEDGRVFLTMFVLDSEARAGIESGRTGFSFKHRTPIGDLHAEKSDDPTYAVGYGLGQFEELVHSAGLKLNRWIRGYWSQGNPGEIFQDAVILQAL